MYQPNHITEAISGSSMTSKLKQKPEDFWFSSKKKGIMIFALPGEPGLTELAGDFKIYFNDRQGDFYCWLNTTMMENRIALSASELDDFDKRKIPAPGFQVEIVTVDYDGSHAKWPTSTSKESEGKPVSGMNTGASSMPSVSPRKNAGSHDKDDVFSDSDSEGTESSKNRHAQMAGNAEVSSTAEGPEIKASKEETTSIEDGVESVSLRSEEITKNTNGIDLKYDDNIKSTVVLENSSLGSTNVNDFKPVAADASFFTFRDEDDYESD